MRRWLAQILRFPSDAGIEIAGVCGDRARRGPCTAPETAGIETRGIMWGRFGRCWRPGRRCRRMPKTLEPSDAVLEMLP